MLTNTKIALPWWLCAVLVLEILPCFFGPYAALSNPTALGGAGATELSNATYFYAARNLAVGIALIMAFWLRNAPMLFALILVRFITDLIDLPVFLMAGLAKNPPVAIAIFTFVYYIPAIIAMIFLWKKLTAPADALAEG